jgi:hypothetical protein
LTQLARTRQGYLDQHLMETALSSVRYWSVFQDPLDAPTLAGLMFPLTGQKVIGTHKSGRPEYQPIQAERQDNERRLRELGHREVILWDRQGRGPGLWLTPRLTIGTIGNSDLEQFEAAHLKATGTALSDIRSEITARQERVRQLLNEWEKRTVPPTG